MVVKPVKVARIYLTEAEHKLDELLRRLHDEEGVAGVTAYRGIAGFGASGKVHTASLIDVSLNLPLVVEFFDEPARVDAILKDLNEILEPGHVLTWSAECNCQGED